MFSWSPKTRVVPAFWGASMTYWTKPAPILGEATMLTRHPSMPGTTLFTRPVGGMTA